MSALESCPYKCEQELCACCELSVNRLKKLDKDHVSKKALREWCEKVKTNSILGAMSDENKLGYSWALNEIIMEFCKESHDR